MATDTEGMNNHQNNPNPRSETDSFGPIFYCYGVRSGIWIFRHLNLLKELEKSFKCSRLAKYLDGYVRLVKYYEYIICKRNGHLTCIDSDKSYFVTI